MKVCGDCKNALPREMFNARKASKDGLSHRCRGCQKVYATAYREAHKDQLREKFRQMYQNNPDLFKARVSRYREANLEESRRRALEYQHANRTAVYVRQSAWAREKRKTDVQYKLRANLRRRLNRALNGKRKASSAVTDLGCTVEFLKQWLESKFSSGMTWENYGPFWHIDHVKPLTAFDLSDPEQAKQACNYTNLQPLPASDNIRKGGVTKRRIEN